MKFGGLSGVFGLGRLRSGEGFNEPETEPTRDLDRQLLVQWRLELDGVPVGGTVSESNAQLAHQPIISRSA